MGNNRNVECYSGNGEDDCERVGDSPVEGGPVAGYAWVAGGWCISVWRGRSVSSLSY